MAEEQNDYITVCVPARLRLLNVVRHVVREAADAFGFSEADAAQIVMAVDEACANVLQHGYGASDLERDKVYVRTIFGKDRLIVEVIDEAERFSPMDRKALDLEEFLEGGQRHGFGLYVIRTLMDELEHEYREGQGNRLRLVKHLPVSPQ